MQVTWRFYIEDLGPGLKKVELFESQLSENFDKATIPIRLEQNKMTA